MMTWVYGSQILQANGDAVNFCADYIGSVQTISTNDYANEIRMAFQTNGLDSCRTKWGRIFSYNNQLPSYRRTPVEDFALMVQGHAKSLQESEREGFLTNIYRRAQMTTEEMELFRDEYISY